jgi:hypothetical protein
MFEVIVTCRPDFREEVVERCASLEEARALAEQLALQSTERFVRVWVRRAIGMKSNCTPS